MISDAGGRTTNEAWHVYASSNNAGSLSTGSNALVLRSQRDQFGMTHRTCVSAVSPSVSSSWLSSVISSAAVRRDGAPGLSMSGLSISTDATESGAQLTGQAGHAVEHEDANGEKRARV